MKITIINFSGRQNGNCHNITNIVKGVFGADNEVIVKETRDLAITPCGGCNYECFAKNVNCPHVKDDVFGVYDSVCRSDLAVYIVPNYCDYPNANFFIFNERSQCFFQNHPEALERYLGVSKKFIVVSNTERDNFKRAFAYHVMENVTADILFLAAKDFHKSSVNGDLMDSAQARLSVEMFIKK